MPPIGFLSGSTAGPATGLRRARSRLLAWSGPTRAEAEQSRRHLVRLLQARGEAGFADLASVWCHGGPGHVRGAVVAANAEQALAALAAAEDGDDDAAGPARTTGPVAVLLPGQGTQSSRFAHGLCAAVPLAAGVVEDVVTLLGSRGRAWWHSWQDGSSEFADDDAGGAMALLFAVDVAVTRVLRSWGVAPSALLGQGVGELAALHVAGVLDLADAVGVLGEYAEAVGRLPAQGMVAACAGPDAVLPHLPEGVHLACDNGPTQVLVAGPRDALDLAEERLDDAGWAVMPVRAGAAYHTPWMAPAAQVLHDALAATTRRPPTIALVSAVTARILEPGQAVDPRFWADAAVRPVRMWDALSHLSATLGPGARWIEVGRGSGMATLARRHPRVRAAATASLGSTPVGGGASGPVLSMLSPYPATAYDDGHHLLGAAATLWTSGADVDLDAVEASFA